MNVEALTTLRDTVETFFNGVAAVISNEISSMDRFVYLKKLVDASERTIHDNFALCRHYFPSSNVVYIDCMLYEKNVSSACEAAKEFSFVMRMVLAVYDEVSQEERERFIGSGPHEDFEQLAKLAVEEVNQILNRSERPEVPPDDRYEFCKNQAEFASFMGYSKSAVVKWNKKKSKGDSDFDFYEEMKNGSYRVDKLSEKYIARRRSSD